MSIALSRKSPLLLGAAPRANLLPPSVLAAQRGRRAVRVVLLMVVASIGAVAVGMGAMSVLVAQTASALQAERAKSDALLAAQAEYSDVRELLSTRSRLLEERAAAAATDVDWSAYLGLIRGTLAPGMALQSADVQASTPLEQIVQPTAPLQAPRIATLSLTATASDLASVEAWLAALQTLPGYTDAQPGSISAADDGTITAQVTVGVGEDAWSHRFDVSEEDR
ncbi:hypothetical protein [Naasia sp. SYSU D00948]|uniref:hypothetical protein n=1 Tax=Naasia sp. SYSU D00948 TaxID=2817379 RepID=UPI001B306C79|nr:hypothetical protein [Naasia sp. SYSU D00948]